MNFGHIFRRHRTVIVPGVLLLASHIVWSATSALVALVLCFALSAGALVYFKQGGNHA